MVWYNCRMRLLIDGYNLLHATDLFGVGKQAGTLQGSREALLAFLAASLSAGERRTTTIVFDAAGAPPGLPNTVHHDHITANYARKYADADAMLEELIEEHRSPRSLLVVSSDHRVQRAARRRGAKYADSEPWYRNLAQKSRRRKTGGADRPAGGGSIEYWVNEFNDPELAELENELRQPGGARPRPTKSIPKQPRKPAAEEIDMANPFPPGYGEDLLDNER